MTPAGVETPQTNSSPKAARKALISEAIFLAITPAIAYAYVFAHDASYLAALWIPRTFIGVDPSAVLSVVALFCVLLALPFAFGISTPPKPRNRASSGRYARNNVVVPRRGFILGSVLAIVSSLPWLFAEPSGFLSVTYAGLGGVLGVAWSYFQFKRKMNDARRYKRTLFDALRYHLWKPIWFMRSNRFDRRLSRVGSLRLAFVGLTMFGMFFANIMGYVDAGKDDWLVVSTKPERAIILKDGDQVLAATFDRRTKVLGSNFAVLKIDNDFPNPIKLERVGPLTPRGWMNFYLRFETTTRNSWLKIKETGRRIHL